MASKTACIPFSLAVRFSGKNLEKVIVGFVEGFPVFETHPTSQRDKAFFFVLVNISYGFDEAAQKTKDRLVIFLSKIRSRIDGIIRPGNAGFLKTDDLIEAHLSRGYGEWRRNHCGVDRAGPQGREARGLIPDTQYDRLLFRVDSQVSQGILSDRSDTDPEPADRESLSFELTGGLDRLRGDQSVGQRVYEHSDGRRVGAAHFSIDDRTGSSRVKLDGAREQRLDREEVRPGS